MNRRTKADGWGAMPWRWIGWGFALLLLAIPLAAMQLTDEVAWQPGDFLVAGILIGLTGLAFEIALRNRRSRAYRAAAAVALLSAFAMIWVNGAVGLIGGESDPANFLYGAVLLVALVGVIVAGLDARLLMRAMTVTVVAQIIVTVFAITQGLGSTEPPGSLGILLVNMLFAALWAASALLFRRAAK